MSQRRSIYLIAILIFFTIMLGFGIYVIQQTQTIENQAQVTDAVINESSCLLQGGTALSSDLATPTCPSGYTKAGIIENSLNQTEGNQTTPQKICCIPLPTTQLTNENPTISLGLTEAPTTEPSASPTSIPSPSIAPSLDSGISPTPPIPTNQLNACVDAEKVPQLEVQINYICPSCK